MKKLLATLFFLLLAQPSHAAGSLLTLTGAGGHAASPTDLPWASPSKLLGVRVDTQSDTTVYQTWLGRSVDQSMAFANGSTWANLIAYATSEAGRSVYGPIHWTLDLPPGVTMAQIVAGTYDTQLLQVANIMANARPSDAQIPLRIWQEFQIAANPWTSVGVEATWVQAYRHVVKLFLGVSNRFRPVWCPNYTTTVAGSPYDPSQVYPGDDVVSVIGYDVYYQSLYDSTNFADAFGLKLSSSYGLNWLQTFAATHNKPVSIDEWGIDANGGQMYISSMLELFQSMNLAWQNYYNVDNGAGFMDRLDQNQYPTTGTRFITEFQGAYPTNLFSVPNDLTNAAWTKTASTVSGTTYPDPYNGSTAQQMLETTATSVHMVGRTLSKPASTGTYRVWWNVLPLTRNWDHIQVYQNSYGDGTSAYFNISTGAYGGYFAYGSMGTPIPFFYKDPYNSFYKTGYEFTATADPTLIVQLQAATADGTDSYLGVVTDGLQTYTAWIRKVN